MNNRIVEQNTTLKFNQCAQCKFKFKKTKGCRAFSKEIPLPILLGNIAHNKRLFEQKNDIFFEKE